MAEAEFPELNVVQNTPRLGPDDRFAVPVRSDSSTASGTAARTFPSC